MFMTTRLRWYTHILMLFCVCVLAPVGSLQLLLSLQSFLTDPNPDHALVPEIAELYRTDRCVKGVEGGVCGGRGA